MMPQSSQNLYFHLGMNADDDGFCEHFSIMRMTDSKPDDLKVLQAKGFVNVFDDRVLIIKDWKENNYLRSDRYVPSKYLGIYSKEMALLGIPTGNQRYTQDRIGKDSKEEEKSFASQNISSFKVVSDIQPKEKKQPRNKEAMELQYKLYDLFEKEKYARPTENKQDYFQILRAKKRLTDKQIIEIVEDALGVGKVRTVREAITDRAVDTYLQDNS